MTITEAITAARSAGLRMTCTNYGKDKDFVGGCRITIYDAAGNGHSYILPQRNGWAYVQKWPGGKHAKAVLFIVQSALETVEEKSGLK